MGQRGKSPSRGPAIELFPEDRLLGRCGRAGHTGFPGQQQEDGREFSKEDLPGYAAEIEGSVRHGCGAGRHPAPRRQHGFHAQSDRAEPVFSTRS